MIMDLKILYDTVYLDPKVGALMWCWVAKNNFYVTELFC